MKTITLKLHFLLIFLFLSTLVVAQDSFPTVGIVGTATTGGWDESTPMDLQFHDNSHQWVLTTQLTKGELKFRANNSWDVNWGGSQFPTGTALRNGDNINIPATSYYTIYFNSASGDYHFEALSPATYETVGIIGDATTNGWVAAVPMTVDPYDSHSWFLESISLTAGEIKFLANNDWNVKSWGGHSFPEGVAYDGNNIGVTAGEYAVTFNDVTGKYSFKILNAPVYETVGIIGTATENEWGSSTAMQRKSAEGPNDWLLTTYLKAGELKFRANDAWDVDWGGTEFPTGTAVFKGPNLTVPESGYYNISFNDFYGVYNFVKLNPVSYASVGIVGSATPGAWDNSTPMAKAEDGHTWSLENFELSGGAVKFRVDNSWTVNWGGADFPEGTAVQNGGDIPVSPGFYNISFNDVTRKYSFELTGEVTTGIVMLDPPFPTADEPVTITYDATQGISGLRGAEKVYLHSGVILSGPEGTAWNNVVGNWGQDDGVGEMTPVEGEPNKWQITLTNIREYFSVEGGVPVFRLGMVFRNADGNKIGKSETDGDIFVNINPGDFIRFTAPVTSKIFGVSGDALVISAEASEVASYISVEINDGNGYQPVHQENDVQTTSFIYNISSSGTIQLKVSAQIGENMVSSEKTISIYVRKENTVAELPEGVSNGINYDPEDPTKATLVLLAPQKKFVYAVGDFNDWEISDSFQMNQTPDEEYFWLELTGLKAQREYVFQYWVEGIIKIGDPYADKVADPFSDGNIPAQVYPNPLSYSRTQDGIATVLQTGQQPYQWNFPEVAGGRPANEDLVIYELLVRDFVESHSYKEVIEKLPYLKELGVNAIELLPIMEFENNESWGYNPTYLFAPDKYYGSKNDLKEFIDKAHEMGMVVLLDMVHNHQFGQSPMVRMYFDEASNRPAANSPWFNQEPTHPYNVGYDFNHESQYTKNYIDDVNSYWIEEYKFDGYRFDLTKGFTQKNNPNDVGAWSAYDQSRIDILKRMTDVIRETDPSAYVIMEHLADNSEEKILADYGIMLWGNMNHDYNEVVIGNTGANLNWALSNTRGWNDKNLVSYMESHDEERLIVRALNFGAGNGDYDIKQPETALERIKLASAFYYTVPGPKMIWQFGELGYDYPIDYNGRTGNKPIPWGDRDGLHYDQDESRMNLYGAKAAMINLVNLFPDVFEEGEFSWTPTGQFRTISITHPEMNVVIVGNFGVTEGEMSLNFQEEGIWYDFFSGQSFNIDVLSHSLTLEPGEFHMLVNQPVNFPEGNLTSNTFVFLVDPTELKAEAGEALTVKITWNDNTAGETGYLLQRKSEEEPEFVTIAILGENIEEYWDNSTVDGVTYEYQVKAITDSNGESNWSNAASVDLPLLAPEGLKANVADSRSVTLNWEDKSNHESSYILERSVENGNIISPFVVIKELAANTVTYIDGELRPGITYHYRLMAKDSDENSHYSNTASIRPAEGLGDHFGKSLRMYPNPASSELYISTSLEISEPARLQIVNLQGMVVKTFEIQPGSQEAQVNVSDLKNGIYIVHEVNSASSFGKLLMIKR